MYYVFTFYEKDIKNTYIYMSIEGDDSYIAYSMISKYYSNIENLKYIGEFKYFDDVSANIPNNTIFDICDYDEFYLFKKRYFEKYNKI
jgi:hypothetical protein